MIVLPTLPAFRAIDGAPLSPLNAVWCGQLQQAAMLPQLGHLHLLLPLDSTPVSFGHTLVTPDQYLLLTPAVERPLTLSPAQPNAAACLLLLWLSPGFIADMADFLGIDPVLSDLLASVPLPQGDILSRLLKLLAVSLQDGSRDDVEELVMEVVGQVLHQLRQRQQTLLGLAPHREATVADLLPLLLQARQFIQARCTAPLRTRDVATHIGLSEYHFARLFKAAFAETVHQFGLRLRLDEARRRLEATDTAVTDIAFDIGYSSLSAFNRAFRLRFGQTPTAYRAIFRETQS